MTEEELLTHFPRLYHMAADGSWPSIEEHGLLSTNALLDLHGVTGNERAAIFSRHRPECISVSGHGLPPAVVRDQKPMSESALLQCLLDGVTPQQWFELLNKRVFFWLSKRRLNRLLNARAYRDTPQVVLTLETRTLVDAHRQQIELCPINSGSTIMNPVPRGLDAFLPIAEYPFDVWRRKRSRKLAIAELVVLGSVPDVRNHVLAVHRVLNGQPTALWRREGSSPDEGP